jgi:hypothetical protein
MQEKIPTLQTIPSLAKASEALASQIEAELDLPDPPIGAIASLLPIPSGDIYHVKK